MRNININSCLVPEIKKNKNKSNFINVKKIIKKLRLFPRPASPSTASSPWSFSSRSAEYAQYAGYKNVRTIPAILLI